MTTGLLLSLIGLALLDSANVSTIWVVVAILLLARKPLRTGWAFAVGGDHHLHHFHDPALPGNRRG